MTDLLRRSLATFAALFDEALAAGEPDPTAMVVATAGLDARPSARTVLLKAHDARGFVFYTHLTAARAANCRPIRTPRCCSTGRACARACRCASRARSRSSTTPRPTPISPRARAAASSAPGHRCSRRRWMRATTSSSASPRSSRHSTAARCRARRAGPGLRVRPDAIEFWYGAEFRLHERWRYECDARRRMVEADAVSVSRERVGHRCRSACTTRMPSARVRTASSASPKSRPKRCTRSASRTASSASAASPCVPPIARKEKPKVSAFTSAKIGEILKLRAGFRRRLLRHPGRDRRAS